MAAGEGVFGDRKGGRSGEGERKGERGWKVGLRDEWG